MKVLLNPLIEAASGALGTSVVLYKQGGRNFAREYVVPNNPQTGLQQIVRAFQASISTAYQQLTDAKYTAWNAFAEFFTRRDTLGVTYKINGQAAFGKVNMYRLMEGQAITDTPPAYSVVPAVTSITATTDPGTTLSLVVNHSITVAGQFLFFRFTRPLPSARRLARKNDLSIITTDFAGAIVPLQVSGATYNFAQTRWTVPAQARIGVQITGLSSGFVPNDGAFANNIEAAEL